MKEPTVSIHEGETLGAASVHQNVGKFLPHCMMAYSRRLYSSKSVSRELQMLDTIPYLFINKFIHILLPWIMMFVKSLNLLSFYWNAAWDVHININEKFTLSYTICLVVVLLIYIKKLAYYLKNLTTVSFSTRIHLHGLC